MIELQNLVKRFGNLTAVDGVSFTVQRGEVLGFLGPNGAGKSTTMKMVTGFLAPTSGRVSVCGHDLAVEPIPAKRRIGYLPEGAPLYGDMTPRAFLRFMAEIRAIPREQRAARIGEVVAKTHLDEVLEQPIETLSKGFKRRVGLAQAIVHDPEVLVLDEPTDGLDPNQKHEVRQLIRAMAPHKAIVLSTHILEEVEAVCTRAMIIARGRVVFDGTPEELLAKSRRHNAVCVTLRAAVAAQARVELARLPGVAEVVDLAPGDGTARLLVLPARGHSILLEVGQQARSRNWEVLGLEQERGRLDEVFRELTRGSERGLRAEVAA
ncbi:MAG: ABC transporter ATP-binding protein [Planctomycetota bacterium]|nr:MAG: ABC transporter ATP-binding protein [Planctomycetota bacterium]